MSVSQLVLRFIAGGAVVVVVSLLANTSRPTLAGLFVLFPAVTLVSFAFLAGESSTQDLRRVALFSLYSFPTTLVFLATFFLCLHRLGAVVSLVLAVVSWLVVAAALVTLNLRFLHI